MQVQGGNHMKIRMYNMNALSAVISRFNAALGEAFTIYNVSMPSVKFTDDITNIEFEITNVTGLRSITFEVDNKDFGLWIIFTKPEGSMSTIKTMKDFEEKISSIKTNNMLKMQLECIKSAVNDSLI